MYTEQAHIQWCLKVPRLSDVPEHLSILLKKQLFTEVVG